jgi:nitrate reductase gamma subunit
VETGAGGSTAEGAVALVLGGLAAAGAVAGMLVLGLRRRSA